MAKTVKEDIGGVQTTTQVIRTYKVKIKGTTPLLMNKFPEIEGNKKGMEPAQQAELAAYRLADGMLCIPARALWKTVINGASGKKFGKKSAVTFFASGFTVTETDVSLGVKDYEIDKQTGRIPPRTGARVWLHRPRLDKWECSFHVNIDFRVFNTSQPSLIVKAVKEVIEYAGLFVGVLDYSPRLKGPYGKFEVVSFEEV